MDESAAHARLAVDGLIVEVAGHWRTTRRWQAAMMRAALWLQQHGDASEDLRVPVIIALTHLYGDLSDDELSRLVVAILPIEERELQPAMSRSGGR